ncbi:hypothetical protein BJ875DRAFT_439630 [Amylocarpus encephaloides]|uniref:Uncharacterized protein n=1 Tax=Amylocarpus encephaloides TaxID=45428 RepID=A0A9P7YNB7_9HELO|nr:hypothetical protein BJ875DRAFT_439630 [Amylocarpus encephaloides]
MVARFSFCRPANQDSGIRNHCLDHQYGQELVQQLYFDVDGSGMSSKEESNREKLSKRCWASVKTYMRKGKTDDVYRKLERAKTMLNLMISNHILAMQQKSAEMSTPQKDPNDSEVVTIIEEVDAKYNIRDPANVRSLHILKSDTAITNYSMSCFLGLYNRHSGVRRVSQTKDGKVLLSDGHQIHKWIILPSDWLCQWGVAIMCMNKGLRWE